MEIVKEKTEFKNEVTIRELDNGVYALNRNGYDLKCPHQPPMKMIMPNPLDLQGTPKAQIVHANCMSTCPLFIMEKRERDELIDVHLGCSSVVSFYYGLKKIK